MPNYIQTTPEHRLEIDQESLREIVQHCEDWLPYEGCGLLACRDRQVVRVYPGDNIARSETFYEMDPKQVYQADREIEADGLRLGAIFHSHPSTKAWPSPTDLKLIFDPDVYMVIVSFAGEEADVRAFRYDGDIAELPVIVSGQTEGAPNR